MAERFWKPDLNNLPVKAGAPFPLDVRNAMYDARHFFAANSLQAVEPPWLAPLLADFDAHGIDGPQTPLTETEARNLNLCLDELHGIIYSRAVDVRLEHRAAMIEAEDRAHLEAELRRKRR